MNSDYKENNKSGEHELRALRYRMGRQSSKKTTKAANIEEEDDFKGTVYLYRDPHRGNAQGSY
jgi:hypothetical protein